MSSLYYPARKKKIVHRQTNGSLIDSTIHPVLDRVYRHRGVKSANELNYSMANLLPPHELSGIESAVEIIVEAIQADASILISGDYDTDGATGCALGYLVLKAFGARNVAYCAPDRFKFGYGLTKNFVEFLSELQPDLIITVDNGIASIDGVRLANEKGISVVVTDHHLPGEELPEAEAIINPNLPDDQFQSKNLSGVGVLFYLLSVVRSQLSKTGWFEREGIKTPNMADYLDLVAVGTVADMVPLDYNNRILVQQGLARINAGKCRLGIRMLLEFGRRHIGKIVAEDLAFAVGPRLNAAGRIEDISIGIQCLVSNTKEEVEKFASQLDKLNIKRKETQNSMIKDATQHMEKFEQKLHGKSLGHCLYSKEWHAGIVGLVAQKVSNLTGKPTIAFAPADDRMLRGSCRSIQGLNIRDLIADISVKNPGLVPVFGGHAMAAGLSLEVENFEKFQESFEDELYRIFGDNLHVDEIYTDGELEEINLDTAQALANGGPWGQQFVSPTFDGEFEIAKFEVVGEGHLRLRVRSSNKNHYDAIYFNYFESYENLPDLSNYRMVYSLEVNEFQNNKSVQLRTLYMEPASDD